MTSPLRLTDVEIAQVVHRHLSLYRAEGASLPLHVTEAVEDALRMERSRVTTALRAHLDEFVQRLEREQ